MKILKTLAIVTVSGIMATTAIVAQPMDGHPSAQQTKHHKGMMKKKIKAALKAANVTKEQRVQLKEARKSMRETMKAKREEMKASYNPKEFISVNGVNRTAMVNMAVEMATFRANLRADMMEKTLAILSPEQRTQFVQALKAN